MRTCCSVVWFSLGLLALQAGPHTATTTRPPSDQASAFSHDTLEARNNSASLLYALLNDEKNVSKLLLIKRDRKPLHDLVKRISSSSAAAVTKLEQFAKKDPALDLKATRLPAGERMAREAESKATGHELLHSQGDDFEFKLLLAQAEATRYAAHLARTVAANEADPNRRDWFIEIGKIMDLFYDEITDLLRANRRAN